MGQTPREEPTALVETYRIERSILLIRGKRVMLDADLAEIFGVSTKVLNQAVNSLLTMTEWGRISCSIRPRRRSYASTRARGISPLRMRSFVTSERARLTVGLHLKWWCRHTSCDLRPLSP